MIIVHNLIVESMNSRGSSDILYVDEHFRIHGMPSNGP